MLLYNTYIMEQTMVCKKCGIEKEHSKFRPRLDRPGKHYGQCKKCESDYKKGYKLKNKEIIKIKDKLYRNNNIDKIKERHRANYYKDHKKTLENDRLKRIKNRDRINARLIKWKKENPDKKQANDKRYYKNHYDAIRKYNLSHGKKLREGIADPYVKQKLKRDGFKIITPELIELKRVLIKANRILKTK